ncbi:MAG: glycoside hydrolase family 3 N-terminal domain-containing protein, partial [Bacteroidales bacterium]
MECEQWVDSVFNTLTIEQQLAQCMMPAVYPRDSAKVAETIRMIKQYNPGGIIIFQGGPRQVALLVNKMQSLSRVPLLLGVDGEWGIAMRFDSVLPFPRQLTLGAIDNDSLIYQMGVAIASQLHRMGIHTNFSPVVDINSNPLNPVIGSRSWGSNRDRVTHQSLIYMRALQENGIIAVAKHFPGHGDTENDSHYALPVITHSRQRLDTFELYPFKTLIEQGVMGIMTAHLNVRAYDSAGIPASLSRRVTDSLLKQVLNFKGLVFTDALDMKGAQNGSAKKIAMSAFLAGNDILLMPVNLPDALDTLVKAVRAGIISQAQVQQRCKKILSAKYMLGIHRFQPVDTAHLIPDLNQPVYQLIRRQLYESALTLLTNHDELLPLKRLDTLRIAIVAIGDTLQNNSFKNTAELYTSLSYFALHREATDSDFYQVYQQLSKYNLVITLLLNTDMRLTRRYGVNERQINYLELIAFNHPTVLCVFGSPYLLNFLSTLAPFKSIMLAYEDNPTVYDIAAQAIFGGISVQGRLPVDGIAQYPFRAGIIISTPIRVKYTLPEEVGINSVTLNRAIDSVILSAIRQKAMPGCIVYLAKENKVFFHRAYGYFTYDSVRPVTINDMYDLASITKIAATTPAIMKLYEQDKIKLNAPISKYIPKLRKSNKAKLTVADILSHQAGLQPVIDILPHVLIPELNTTGKNGKQSVIRYLGRRPGIFSETLST